MYPLYDVAFFGQTNSFSCKLIKVIDQCTVMLRPVDMCIIYNVLMPMIENFYTNHRAGWELTFEQAIPGASCVLFKSNCIARCEIVTMDDEDRASIFLVDECEFEYAALSDLFVPHPIALAIPVLAVSCTLFDLTILSDGYAALVKETIAGMWSEALQVHDIQEGAPGVQVEQQQHEDYFTAVLVSPGVPVINLYNHELSDIAAGVLDVLKLNDEGFEEIFVDDADVDEEEEEIFVNANEEHQAWHADENEEEW